MRLLHAYVAWVAIYNIANLSALIAVLNPSFWLRLAFQGGAAPHLWYLPSVALCFTILIATGRLLIVTMQWTLGLFLYATGLLLGSYYFVIFGSPASQFQLHAARDVTFFGFIFVYIGFWLGHVGYRPSFKASLAIFRAGGVFPLSEAWTSAAIGLRAFSAHDYLIGTLSFGVGSFLMALTLPYSHHIPLLSASLGQHGMGLYAIHVIFVNVLDDVLQPHNIGVCLLSAGMTISLSLLIVVPLAKVPRLRQFLV